MWERLAGQHRKLEQQRLALAEWSEQLAAREARLKRRHQRLRAALHTLMAEEEARMQQLAAALDYLVAAQDARQAWLRVRMLEWGC